MQCYERGPVLCGNSAVEPGPMLGTVVEKQLPKMLAASFKIDSDGRGNIKAEDPFGLRTDASLVMSLPSTLRSPRGKGVMDETIFRPCRGEASGENTRPTTGLAHESGPDADSSVTSPSGTDISLQCLPEHDNRGPFCGQPSPLPGKPDCATRVVCRSEMEEEGNAHSCRGRGLGGLTNGSGSACGGFVPILPICDRMVSQASEQKTHAPCYSNVTSCLRILRPHRKCSHVPVRRKETNDEVGAMFQNMLRCCARVSCWIALGCQNGQRLLPEQLLHKFDVFIAQPFWALSLGVVRAGMVPSALCVALPLSSINFAKYEG